MQQKNFFHLYADIAWYGVLAGSTLAFLSIYLARLGADSFRIGMLTAGPALVNLLVSLPMGGLLGKRSLIRVPYWSAFFQRSGYLLLALLPWLLKDNIQVGLIILIILLTAVPGTLLAISINAVLAEIVPIEHRAEVVGKRNALLAITTTLSALVSGMLLDGITFPLNYQVVFGIGWLGSSLSTYHLSRLKLPTQMTDSSLRPMVENSKTNRSGFKASLNSLARASLQARNGLSYLFQPGFIREPIGRFMAAYLVFYTFQYQGVPIFPLVYVESLKLTDGMISLGSALFYVAMFVISLSLKRLAARFGHHILLAVSAIMFGIYPLLVGLADGPLLFWLASLLGGLVYGIVSASLLNRLMEVIPEDKRTAGMSLHNLALNLGILLGALSGPILANAAGIQGSMLWVAAFRSLSGLVLLFWA